MTLFNELQLQEIDTQTLKQWLEENSVKLVDVREPAEYATERIPGAQLYPLSQFNPEQVFPETGQRLVLYPTCVKLGFTPLAHGSWNA